MHSIQELQYMKPGTEGQKTSRPFYHKECLSRHIVASICRVKFGTLYEAQATDCTGDVKVEKCLDGCWCTAKE